MSAHLIAEDGPLQGLILDLKEGDEWTIGRSSDTADLVVDDTTVSRKHAKLHRTPEGIYLKNLSKVNATLINGEEHGEPVLLKEGDHVLIGETTFLFSEEDIPDLSPNQNKRQKNSLDDVFEELGNSEEENLSAEETHLRGKDSKESSYDTIFEDIPEEEVPFNLPSEAPFLLKVISGPNAGAEIGMEKGKTYTLGKDSQTCDIIFQDLSVSRAHAKISISPEGVIEIEDLGSKNGTAVNGTPITEKQIITSQDLIALGTTIFLIIDREAPQDTIYSPLTPAEEAVQKSAEEEEIQEEIQKDWKKQPIPMKHLVAIGSVAAVFLIVFFSFFSLFKSQSIEIVHKEPVSEIRDALKESKFSDVEFSFNPASGKLFLVGHVLTAVDYQEMRYRISQIPFILSVEDTVVIDEGVSKAINDILTTNSDWKGISVRAVSPGKFVASGYLQTNAELNQVSDYLTVNFPYLDRLEYKIATEENLQLQLGGLFLSQGFGAVSYQLNNGEVLLSGVYDERKEKEFQELIKEIKKMPAITAVKNFATPTNANMAAINLTQDYQVGGISLLDGKGFNAILNGRIYTIGQAVNGMNIIHIDENTILLEKDGVKYKIEYTR